MAKFKVGDLVKCVEADSILILYAVYRVSKVNSCGMVFLEGETESRGWYPQRFELVEEPPKTTPHIHAALIKAWADGAKIECRYHPKGEWFDTESPSWNLTNEYRIKPEPKPDVVRYARARATNYDHMCLDDSEKNWEATHTCWTVCKSGTDNIKATFDGETGKLKSVEMV